MNFTLKLCYIILQSLHMRNSYHSISESCCLLLYIVSYCSRQELNSIQNNGIL